MNRVLIQDRLTGCLFLLPLLAYGLGNALFDAALKTTTVADPVLIAAGTLLWILNAVTVVAVAAILYPLLQQYSKAVAAAYLAARLMEAVLLLMGMFALRAGIHTELTPEPMFRNAALFFYRDCYQVAMLLLGTGSMAFCGLLCRHRLLPLSWSVWGFAGYGFLAAGAVAELCGLHWGLYASIPGGLFELTLGIRLIGRGWNRL
ncbi:DUF4386 family protein [Edaphocola aurantiacus]|uniref:DUF4386 family protein n=1 Tax=Edaphocola aurantiacus TaxID=2601682 RepID=UPI001C9484B9|nr:DUF4386 family protein [Edaphocola aurantiacus]